MGQKKLDPQEFSRRDFVKAAGAVFGAVAVSAWLPSLGEAGAQAKRAAPPRFKGTANGQILTSPDGGKTWQVAVDFGPQCKVQKVIRGRTKMKADLVYEGLPFTLVSTDGRTWYTDSYQAPA